MLRPDFFSGLGVFVEPQFADQALCDRIVAEMRSGSRDPATVRSSDGRYEVRSTVRSATLTEVSEATTRMVEQKLRDLQPAIAKHYDLALHDLQTLQFLTYQTGDFYTPHTDHARDDRAAAFSKARQVSIVVFLNSSEDERKDGSYGGGFLTLYGLIGDPRTKGRGFPLAGTAGALVAFRSETVHEVTPVTWGERRTIVTWFTG